MIVELIFAAMGALVLGLLANALLALIGCDQDDDDAP